MNSREISDQGWREWEEYASDLASDALGYIQKKRTGTLRASEQVQATAARALQLAEEEGERMEDLGEAAFAQWVRFMAARKDEVKELLKDLKEDADELRPLLQATVDVLEHDDDNSGGDAQSSSAASGKEERGTKTQSSLARAGYLFAAEKLAHENSSAFGDKVLTEVHRFLTGTERAGWKRRAERERKRRVRVIEFAFKALDEALLSAARGRFPASSQENGPENATPSTAGSGAAEVVEGLYQRGMDHYFGRNGVTQNYEEAAGLFRLAADRGNAKAQNQLGVLHKRGDGVHQSFEEAARLYRLAADSENAAAQFNLGNLYADGNGVEQSFEEAAHLYRLAADSKNVAGQCSLEANGVEQSFEEAARLYRLAAIWNLAGQYRDGLEVETDVARAKLMLRQVEEAEGAKILIGGVSLDLPFRAQVELASIKKECESCLARGSEMKICVRCQGPRYCGRVCQGADWPRHKRACRSKAETAAMLPDANN